MKSNKQFKIPLLIICILLLAGCGILTDVFAPGTSKAITEKQQLTEQLRQTQLQQDQLLQLQRIADALEKIANK